jgi:CubicO group peptidase (beta-lactamase class C family)
VLNESGVTINTSDPRLRAALDLVAAELEAERAADDLPGISAAVVLDQDVIWARGWGHASVERGMLAAPDTVYGVGSITKVFTATMLMQLRDAGNLHLDDPVAEHVPGFAVKSPFPGSRPITLRQLVSHTSGLPTEAPLGHFHTLRFPSGKVMAESLRDVELLFMPGTRLRYSNLGFAVLGHALERASGTKYTQYVSERILQPLGMTSSGFVSDGSQPPDAATHYRRMLDDGRWAEMFYPENIGGLVPSGDLYSSVVDMARFISLQFRDDSADANGVLAAGSIKEMHAPVGLAPDWSGGIGIGWHLTRIGDYTAVSKSGATFGTTTDAVFLPELRLGMVLFTNSVAWAPRMTTSSLEILAPVVERCTVTTPPLATKMDPAWSTYVGHYTWDKMRVAVQVKADEEGLFAVVSGGLVPESPRLIPSGEGRFRLEGSSTPDEMARFEADNTGRVTGLWLGPYHFERVDVTPR